MLHAVDSRNLFLPARQTSSTSSSLLFCPLCEEAPPNGAFHLTLACSVSCVFGVYDQLVSKIFAKMSLAKVRLPSLKGLQRLINTLIGEGSKQKVDRSRLQPLIYPYSRTAALVQAPYLHQYKNGFAAKETVLAWIITAPLWLYITSKGKYT